MSADSDGDGPGPDELVKVVRITDSDIVGRVVLEQNSFRYPNAVRHDLCRSIGIAGLVELVLVRKARGEPRRDRSVHHLLPRAERLLGALGVRRSQDKLHPAWIVCHKLSLTKTYNCTVFRARIHHISPQRRSVRPEEPNGAALRQTGRGSVIPLKLVLWSVL